MDEDRLRDLLGFAEREIAKRMYIREFIRQVTETSEPEIETDITDADMIKLHIDIALRNGDKEQFTVLSEQLRGMVHN